MNSNEQSNQGTVITEKLRSGDFGGTIYWDTSVLDTISMRQFFDFLVEETSNFEIRLSTFKAEDSLNVWTAEGPLSSENETFKAYRSSIQNLYTTSKKALRGFSVMNNRLGPGPIRKRPSAQES